jgi:hypothetical protein
MYANVNIGDTVTCAETGRQFVAAVDGCTMNYAKTAAGEVLSDAGVDIRERRELSHRSDPFVAYLNDTGTKITGWKGNVLGTAARIGVVQLSRWSHIHGSVIGSYRVMDVHGGRWHGRGSPGMAIRLRPCKHG